MSGLIVLFTSGRSHGQHFFVVCHYGVNVFGFVHYMIIKRSHHIRSAVHKGFGLVLGVLCDPIAAEPRYSVFVNCTHTALIVVSVVVVVVLLTPLTVDAINGA